MQWSQFKITLSEMVGVNQDALHVLLGVAIQLLVALILRRRVSGIIPWLAVLVVECLNEWADLTAEIWPNRIDQWHESYKDLALTMAIPTILLLGVRFAPRLFVPALGVVATGQGPPTQDLGASQSLEN